MTCKEWTSDVWNSRECGRAVKENGLCWIHLAAKRKRDENAAKREARDGEAERRKEAAKKLSERLGFEVYPEWNAWSKIGPSNTKVVISVAHLCELADLPPMEEL